MIQSYFQAEKAAGQFALAVGILACAIGGGFLLKAMPPFYTGLSVPLLLIGIVQIMVGATIARRSDRQGEDLEQLLAESAANFKAQEMPRMEKVMRSFTLIKWAELVLLALGLGLILLNNSLNFPKGLGAGLFAQATLMLMFDYIAEKRGRAYWAFVSKQAE